MCGRPVRVGMTVALAATLVTAAAAQTQPGPPPVATLTMDDAVRLALQHNQSLRAQRLTIDESKADELTASLKPNYTFSGGADGLPVFSPSLMTADFFANVTQYSASLDHVFERGGKRDKRILAAQDTTDVTSKSVADAERQLRFQTQQAFVSVLLAKSALSLAQQDVQSFSQTVEASRVRVAAGDLAEGDFLKISLQKLQFDQDVMSAELALVQTKASLRQFLGYETVIEDFDVVGDLAHTKVTVTLESLRQVALASRPDLLAAQSGVKLATDQVALEIGNRARDVDGSLNYVRNGFGPISTLGAGISFDLPFGDRNQGNIAHAQIAVEQARQIEAATRAAVLTDVASAFAQYQTSEKVLTLYESGYLDQATQSLDIARYVFARGAGSLLDLLDAERTYRSIQLTYRQALAAYLTSIAQLNFVVGRQVVP
ncbi:MAG TPA: TolC family protein [Vicinamibacterales bacterium]|nr:TolC family protein [Vicinamibacterales bacterium]